MNQSESTFCSSFINYNKNDDWIKQLVLTVGKSLSTSQNVRQTLYLFVMSTVYSDDTCFVIYLGTLKTQPIKIQIFLYF